MPEPIVIFIPTPQNAFLAEEGMALHTLLRDHFIAAVEIYNSIDNVGAELVTKKKPGRDQVVAIIAEDRITYRGLPEDMVDQDGETSLFHARRRVDYYFDDKNLRDAFAACENQDEGGWRGLKYIAERFFNKGHVPGLYVYLQNAPLVQTAPKGLLQGDVRWIRGKEGVYPVIHEYKPK
jgi:hypothetical protein